MNPSLRKKLVSKPLAWLRRFLVDLDELISELERGTRREIDIAAEFKGDEKLVAEVLTVKGDPRSARWQQLLRIYCCENRCDSCPHGDYLYRYRRNKRRATLTVEFGGRAVFSPETIERMRKQARPPVAAFDLTGLLETPNAVLQPTRPRR